VRSGLAPVFSRWSEQQPWLWKQRDLAGRYLHAEHDDADLARAGEIVENDLNAIRLRR
jgi:hypothetical protein